MYINVNNCILIFDSREDMYAQESIELLDRSGIKFKQHEEHGIEVEDFAELLMTSGVVLSDDIKWLSFHRYSIIAANGTENINIVIKLSNL